MVLLLCQQISFAQLLVSSAHGKTSTGVQNSAERNLKDVLNELRIHYQVDILFADKMVEGFIVPSRSVNLKAKIEKNLDSILKPLGLHFRKAKDGSYLITRAANTKTADIERLPKNHMPEEQATTGGIKNQPNPLFQTLNSAIFQVKGKVTSETLEGIPGVNVLLKGTTTGTTTDSEGNYSLTVPDGNGILIFSNIGFVSQEVEINRRESINITLKEDIQSLSEVVVVGYGTQEKANLTGSVSTVKFDKIMENRPITNASQALAGKVPGLWVSQNSGQPGSDGALLRVRGWGTMNNANPMIIIDGVEGVMNQVNPNDIKSISVLKDAASAAIYGSRAANGVILITTKSGEYNQKPKVRLSSYIGFQSLARKYDIIDNSAEYMGLWNQALVNRGSDPIFSEEVINNFKNNNDKYLYPNTNFFDEVYRTAVMAEQNVSISGGSGESKYFFSLNNLKQNGIMKETSTNRYGLNLNLESKINNWLNIGGRVNAINQSSKEPFNMARVPYIFANGAYPFTAPYNKDGTFGAVQAFKSNGEMIVGNRNPLIDLYDGYTKNDRMFTRMNAFVDIIFTDYLTFRSNFTIQNTNTLIDRSNKAQVGYTSTGTRAENLDYGSASTLEASRRNANSFNYIWYNTLNFNKQFGEHHKVSAIAGMQIESTLIRNAFSRTTNPPVAGLTQVSAGTAGAIAQGNMQALRMWSYFGRVNYALSDKYLFEVNVRADASSRFAEEYRWGVFPGISAGWRISEEEFMNGQNLFRN
jgi:TonB-linked SusC/RagA family outer membrane protein